MKTKKAVSKRLRLTNSGNIKRLQQHRRHKAGAKSAKQHRQARNASYVNETDVSRIRHLFQ
jgi:large subunit ribosomal protein L35